MSVESDQTYIIDAVQADVSLPQFVFNVLLSLCLYDGMKGRSSASDIVKALSQQILAL